MDDLSLVAIAVGILYLGAFACVYRILLTYRTTQGAIAWIIGLSEPIATIFGLAISWRDIILITGGLFLVWKATTEIHHSMEPDKHEGAPRVGRASLNFGAALVQIYTGFIYRGPARIADCARALAALPHA